MKIVLFTSSALRHKYIAHALTRGVEEVLVISECKPHDGVGAKNEGPPMIAEHFALRAQAEENFFGEYAAFTSPTVPIIHKEVNLPFVYDLVKRYKPDAGFVFGSYIIKEPLLSLIPAGKFINLHLGLSPYYRGSGTNFWPLVNKEPQYVGATLLHINAGIDAGDIIAHVRPGIVADDTVHTLGCKTIIEASKALGVILDALKEGKELSRVSQWKAEGEKYYKKADFDETALRQYYKNIENGLLRDYTEKATPQPRLVELLHI